jgi:hypothetical protein
MCLDGTSDLLIRFDLGLQSLFAQEGVHKTHEPSLISMNFASDLTSIVQGLFTLLDSVGFLV